VISALLTLQPQPFNIFALTRDESSPSAMALIAKGGVTVIQGDTIMPLEIISQIPNLYGAFLVTLPTANEKQQAIPFIDAIAEVAGVQHLIFSSADPGGSIKSETDYRQPCIPHFRRKMAIERHLREVSIREKMKWTILRPTSFMDNLAPGFIGKVEATSLKQLNSTVRTSLVSTRDIGRVARLAFERPEVYTGGL
jgi:uncharacterized protein YbjT (DUF2867 family)